MMLFGFGRVPGCLGLGLFFCGMAGSLSVLFFGSVRLSFLVVSREAVCHQRCAGCVVCVGGCWSFCVIFKFIFGGFWIIIVVKVCWFGVEGGLWGLPGFWREWSVCVIMWFCRF